MSIKVSIYGALRVALVALVAFSLPVSSMSIPRHARRDAAGFVKVAISKSMSNQSASPALSRVTSYESLALDSEYVAYYADFYFGTPPQKVTIRLDTGSSDTWLSTSGSGYNSSESSSFTNTSMTFTDWYGLEGGSSYAKGNIAYETFGFTAEGPFAEDLEFGAANNSTAGTGILGIGTKGTELFSNKPYNNLPYLLKEQGIVNSAAYSLFLNSPNASEGNLIFGGVDYAKIDGLLKNMNSPNAAGNFSESSNGGRLDLLVKSLSVAGSTIDSEFNGTLDTGSPYTSLPTDVFNFLVNHTSAVEEDGSWFVPCDTTYNITLEFEEIEIDFPLRYSLDTTNQNGYCELEIIATSGNLFLLGDDFLRFTYVVYNLDNSTISLGKVKYSDEEDIVSI